MKIIRMIINWIRKFFNKIFGKKKVVKKIKKNLRNAKNKRYLKGYGAFIEESVNESLPLYLFVNNKDKDILLKRINEVHEKIISLNMDNNKEEIMKINQLMEKIEKSNISFYQYEKINEKLDEMFIKEENKVEIMNTISKINDEIIEIVENFDRNIGNKVLEKYNEINYLTLSTLILDETLDEIKKLEEDYKHHRYNKYYYNRKINHIKERILNLKQYSETQDVKMEILRLREMMYLKSKDKYDLLYNDEAYINIESICNELLDKVNKRIIDLKSSIKAKKSEKVIEKKDDLNKKDRSEKNKRHQEELQKLDNILKRFQDLELARKLILLDKDDELEFNHANDILLYLNNIYYNFLNGDKLVFNFERNKTKTELVKFYNKLNGLDCFLNKKEYIFVDHINFPLEDLIDISIEKKSMIEDKLNDKYHFNFAKNEGSILCNNKLLLLQEKEREKNKLNSKTKVYEKKSI